MKSSTLGLSSLAAIGMIAAAGSSAIQTLPLMTTSYGPSYPRPTSRNGQVKVRRAAAKRRNQIRNRRQQRG